MTYRKQNGKLVGALTWGNENLPIMCEFFPFPLKVWHLLLFQYCRCGDPFLLIHWHLSPVSTLCKIMRDPECCLLITRTFLSQPYSFSKLCLLHTCYLVWWNDLKLFYFSSLTSLFFFLDLPLQIYHSVTFLDLSHSVLTLCQEWSLVPWCQCLEWILMYACFLLLQPKHMCELKKNNKVMKIKAYTISFNVFSLFLVFSTLSTNTKMSKLWKN